ncbi:MAG: hypothetical protein CMP15_06725 [Rickettsiales bacterium]|nr:hypothetical protein [Rickettsiales bacterium]MBT35936.1 hypothetical protein [Rickettsiales bacterium]|tara:strand:- start:255 stop:479 length:225 start_codon:yes stop_codon:yes gene_type:complete
MNKNNKKILWQIIQEAGSYLQGKLPEHPHHPNGRNAYAHIALSIKKKFKVSYKDIDDEKLNEVIKYINYLKDNP